MLFGVKVWHILRRTSPPGKTTGQWFETFARGGDRPECRDRITVEDLYAVQALNVQVPFAAGKQLLDGQLGTDIGVHLREIPVDVELGTYGAEELVAEGGHADQAWRLLNSRTKTGIGWVIAGKLLAERDRSSSPSTTQSSAANPEHRGGCG